MDEHETPSGCLLWALTIIVCAFAAVGFATLLDGIAKLSNVY